MITNFRCSFVIEDHVSHFITSAYNSIQIHNKLCEDERKLAEHSPIHKLDYYYENKREMIIFNNFSINILHLFTGLLLLSSDYNIEHTNLLKWKQYFVIFSFITVFLIFLNHHFTTIFLTQSLSVFSCYFVMF